MISKKDLLFFILIKLFACERPIEVPKPPLSLMTTNFFRLSVEGVIVLNNGTGISYIYQISGDATAGVVAAADIALVGIVNQSAALVAANLVYA